ncbi:MAG TPA: amidohydrolase family protein [Usitatibacter sp.]|nr:amidohydrolase family protein [Usitatibacter sp.]
MTIRTLLAALLLPLALASGAETVAWRGGYWFDGDRFVFGTRHSRDGVFVGREPARIDRTVELGERFVVPAYGDAHHHGIDSAEALDDKVTVFLEAGIFYVKNPNAIADLVTPAVRERLAGPGSVDVAFAMGGITSPNGHPVPLHRYLASLGVFRGLRPEDMEDRAYFVVRDEADLEAKWPRIVAARPDFIKTFLLFSEEYEGREPLRRETDDLFHRGLDPKVLAAIVRKAHGAGLRVTTHIDTARDFSNAVDAGVDEINHLPQPDQRFSADLSDYVIDAATARKAAERGITVVTTASTTERLSPSLPAAWLPAMRANQVANLRVLREAGVRVAIGSDGISGERRFVTARDEVRFLARHRMMDNLSLLRAWAVDTPRTIFPARKLGSLAPGYEASFLVLAADPLADPENLHRISMRVKGGVVLPPMPSIRLIRP